MYSGKTDLPPRQRWKQAHFRDAGTLDHPAEVIPQVHQWVVGENALVWRSTDCT
jgi:hypothetical protein